MHTLFRHRRQLIRFALILPVGMLLLWLLAPSPASAGTSCSSSGYNDVRCDFECERGDVLYMAVSRDWSESKVPSPAHPILDGRFIFGSAVCQTSSGTGAELYCHLESHESYKTCGPSDKVTSWASLSGRCTGRGGYLLNPVAYGHNYISISCWAEPAPSAAASAQGSSVMLAMGGLALPVALSLLGRGQRRSRTHRDELARREWFLG